MRMLALSAATAALLAACATQTRSAPLSPADRLECAVRQAMSLGFVQQDGMPGGVGLYVRIRAESGRVNEYAALRIGAGGSVSARGSEAQLAAQTIARRCR